MAGALFWSTSRVSTKAAFENSMEVPRLLFTESFDSTYRYYTETNTTK
jgi:hypothetical protein